MCDSETIFGFVKPGIMLSLSEFGIDFHSCSLDLHDANLYVPETIAMNIYLLLKAGGSKSYIDDRLIDFHELAKEKCVNPAGMEVSILSYSAINDLNCPYRSMVDQFFDAWNEELSEMIQILALEFI